MTTKVSIAVEQEHMPVVVESNSYKTILRSAGDRCSYFVHSAADILIREMTPGELHAESLKGPIIEKEA